MNEERAEDEVRPPSLSTAAMEGLVKEGNDLFDEIDKSPVLTVASVGAAQKVQHHQIASYTTPVLLATKLGLVEMAPLLDASLAEEKATDEKPGTLGQAASIEEAAQS